MKAYIILVLLGLTLCLSKDRERVVSCAKAQLGKPYKLGAAGPNQFDCIGLVRYCLWQIGKGKNIGGVCHYQYSKGKAVAKGNLQGGDAVFFKNNGSGTQPGHVGIYIGGDSYINANSVVNKVTQASLSSNRNYYGARNFID